MRIVALLKWLMVAVLAFGPGLAPAQGLRVGAWERVVPSDGLPPELAPMRGNNNLDIVRHGGRFYFAFRTAPTHFASRRTRIHLLSSEDRRVWRHEAVVAMGSDLREPRFAQVGGRLFLYFFQGGTHPLGFEPRHMYCIRLEEGGGWSAAHDLGLDGFVPWRLRTWGGRLYLSAYDGRGLYTGGHKAEMRLYVSEDGLRFVPISAEPQLGGQGGEEGEFIFDANGDIWGTVRVEGGGAMIFHAHRDSLHRWRTWPTRDKYDSALLFHDGDDIYLVARRNLDGAADKESRLPPSLARWYNLARYSCTRKTTAIWRLDRSGPRLEHVMDLRSTGDTAFPAIVELGEGRWWLLNYSSDIEGPPKSWIRGQLGRTFIYGAELSR